ncbi:hypothetical protein JHK82_028364 [Glycine max]|uniref:Uncharacterized protein n=2 Tax=Glycine subgen. Soja TaxID=1462606 RepID=K7LJT4_SOYBN|nr:hypothetical protein JHK85_029038 [Glycine max]RZB87584.1 hypothetical protein D0Y65_027263 [Glycine soja]KAG5004350.1 hypothetical protein JHK86_028489 [Glycine max]KAG5127529.1 hypothetical protein JHK82_028364 [Glycine max]KAG5152144.1 hypothetical protein JHK84_028616 [Glycine max]
MICYVYLSLLYSSCICNTTCMKALLYLIFFFLSFCSIGFLVYCIDYVQLAWPGKKKNKKSLLVSLN